MRHGNGTEQSQTSEIIRPWMRISVQDPEPVRLRSLSLVPAPSSLGLITVITTSLTILALWSIIISHQVASAENMAVNLDPQEVELQKAMHVRRALGYNKKGILVAN